MQTRRQSMIETLANVVSGFFVTLALSPPIYWIAGVELKFSQLGTVTIMFTLVSVIRSYIVRRWFDNKDTVHVTADKKIIILDNHDD